MRGPRRKPGREGGGGGALALDVCSVEDGYTADSICQLKDRTTGRKSSGMSCADTSSTGTSAAFSSWGVQSLA